ncbi:glycosyltransferase [Solicola sp. PLA-1-18]|uniref:glycosyltransferase n=1 Tax=Solicola sp. PLA-1-18 TaxID=3380532 RepID=UPI003B7621C0
MVPARDEAARIGSCLQAVDDAAARVRRSGVCVEVVVVADTCLDDTADLAEATGALVPRVRLGTVGAARAHGVLVGLDALAVPPATVWVACTDADSQVPPGWLETQLALADAGADVVLGTVRVDPGTVGPDALSRWEHDYALGGALRGPGAHGHVHGANLGVSAHAYLAVGGFAPVGEHEDRLLVDALARAGARAAWTTLAVTTSPRTHGRTPGGFSQVMAEMSSALRPV